MLVEDLNLPGLAVGVATSDGPVFAKGFGFADVELQRVQDANVRHRIGSVTKPMTALCVMALVEEGRLSLDNHVADLLPELAFQGYSDALKVRHLLAHVGGIGEAPTRALLPQARELLMSDTKTAMTVAQLYPDGFEVEVQPGTKWAYANLGYGLLGAIVCKVENRSLNEVMQSRIFSALEMGNSDVLDRPHASLSKGYIGDPDDPGINTPLSEYSHIRGECLRAAGGGQSTMNDMMRFAVAMLRQTDDYANNIVKPETFADMTSPHWRLDDRLVSQGFGFVGTRRFGRQAIVHAGGIQDGWVTMLTLLPEDDLALVTFLNMGSEHFGQVDSMLLEAILDAPRAALAVINTEASMLNAAPGMYQCKPGTLTNARPVVQHGRLYIDRVNDALYLRSQRGAWVEPVRMQQVDADDTTLFALVTDDIEPMHVVLVRENGGEVVAIQIGVTAFLRSSDD